MFIVSDSAGGESNERLLFPKDMQAELNITNIRWAKGNKIIQFVINTSQCMHYIKGKGKYLYSAVSSPRDCSALYTLCSVNLSVDLIY